jgi:hypothetical protein
MHASMKRRIAILEWLSGVHRCPRCGEIQPVQASVAREFAEYDWSQLTTDELTEMERLLRKAMGPSQ